MAEPSAKLIWDGKEIELPVVRGTEDELAIDISKLRSQTGLITLDYGFMNTGATESSITYIDGDAGILRYRGYDIEALAEHDNPSFLETAWLLIYGELPTAAERDEFSREIRKHTLLHEDAKRFYDGFPKDAHPMATLVVGRQRARDLLPASRRPARPRLRPALRDPPARQAPDDRRVLVQEVDRPAVPLPRQLARPHRELPAHDVRGAQRAVRGVAHRRARAEAAADPARRPRAELLDLDSAHGRFVRRQHLSRRSPRASTRCGARSTVARTRPRSKCSKAIRDDGGDVSSRVAPAKDAERRFPALGLRAPRRTRTTTRGPAS